MKLKMPRWLYLASMITTCVACAVCFFFDAFNWCVMIADASNYESGYLIARAISLAWEALTFLGLFLVSLFFLTLRRFRGKDANCLSFFVSLFSTVFGASMLATGISLTSYNGSDAALMICIGAPIMALGAVGWGIKKSFPAARIVNIIGACFTSLWFWISFFTMASAKNPFSIPFFLLGSSMVLFVVGLLKIEVSKEEEDPVEPEGEKKNPTPEDLSMLVKYKELLDSGVITQEDFDKAKKKILG